MSPFTISRHVQLNSIQLKIMFGTGFCLFLAAAIITTYAVFSLRGAAIAAAEKQAVAIAESNAGRIKAELEVAIDTARTLAQVLSTLKTKESSLQLSREQVNVMLKKVLTDNPQFLGVYTAWEPHVFDKWDTQYAGAPGHDQTGRFIPYWVRTDGKIHLEPLLDYETEGVGEYYLCPKRARQECILDPFIYPIQGEDVLMTSLVVPIIVDGQFYGITGVDLRLDFLQELADQVDVFDKTGVLLLISQNGTLAGATSRPELAGQPMKAYHQDWEEDITYVQAGQTRLELDEGRIAVFTPITVGHTVTSWSANLNIPLAKITEAATTLTWQLLGLGTGVAAIALVLVWITAGQITKPIKQLTLSAQVMAGGDLNGLSQEVRTMAQSRRDELGVLGRAFEQMSGYLIEKIVWYEGIIDSFPFPVSVTDQNMNWTFVNKATENLLKVKRSEIVGQACHNWNAHICQTDKCGVQRLRRGQLQTFFAQFGSDFQVDTAYLLDSKGEPVGHVEIVQDISRHTAVSTYQSQVVEQLSGNLDQMAQGCLDFAVAELPAAHQYTVEVRQNMLRLTESLEQTRRTLNQALSTVADNAALVSQASQQLSLAASQAGQATSQIACTIQQVAQGATDENEAVLKTSALVEQVNRTVGGVAQGAQAQAAAVAQASQVTERIAAAEGLSAKVSLSAQKVQEMGTRAQQVEMIVETIEEIASQTNLLALNAAIEAARAGEHGKGFTVVAEEVRKLADRASAATKEISSLTRSIQQTAIQAVEMTTGTAKDIRQASDELVMAIESVAAVVEQNTAATVELSAYTGEVQQATERIASISEENSAAMEEVSAATEEMSAQVEEVTASAHSLSEMAHTLRDLVEQFKLAGITSPAELQSVEQTRASSTFKSPQLRRDKYNQVELAKPSRSNAHHQ